jgi:hypothetical protein
LNHYTTFKYWHHYNKLPVSIQNIADEAFRMLKKDKNHPSLHLKKIKNIWSVRVGIKYRALGVAKDSNIVWFWIGSHDDYDKLIK